METVLQWLILALAVGIGWALGRWGTNSRGRNRRIDDEASLKERLQFLFTNYSDEAIDAFVGSLAVSRETVNLHLSIGAHFRHKGEVDRAILIHQNLLARPELPLKYSSQVTFELAVDYRAAGLLDRAEALLHQVMGSRLYGPKAARQLIDLYQQEREWDKARQVALTLLKVDGDGKLAKQLAYVLCELADEALKHDDRFATRQHLKEALNRDRTCVRAYLQLADLQYREGQEGDARTTLLKVFQHNPAFGPEAVHRLVKYARGEGAETRLIKQLRKIYEKSPSTSLLLAIADYVERAEGREAATDILKTELENRPSLKGLLKLIRLGGHDKTPDKGDSELVCQVGELLLLNKPVYRCGQCGFSGHQLHWLCPSCKTWESVSPIKGVEGE